MKKIVAIMPCRNSEWVCGLSIRALLMWCDQVIAFNHASTDATLDVLEQIRREDDRLEYFSDTETTWREMAHRQRLLESARENNATHVVTIDDDEVLCAGILASIRDIVLTAQPGQVLQFRWFQLRNGIDRYISTGMWSHNYASAAFRDRPDYCWQALNGYDHHHRHPFGTPPVIQQPCPQAAIMHLQMASRRRLCAKQYWYMLTERLRWPKRKTAAQLNEMYGPTVHTECAKDAPVPAAWWHGYEHLMPYLDLSADPWQLEDARRIIRENPGIEAGLDNFGVEYL